MNRPFMSVVVICYNGANTIARTLESLLRQTYPHERYEVIVIDDGSNDSTGSIVARYPEVRYRRLSKNSGIPVARNAGITLAKGDVYVTFDDDSVADPDWLKTLAAGYGRLSDAAGIGGVVMHPPQAEGFTRRFIMATGNGAPAAAETDAVQPSLSKRVLQYARTCFAVPAPPSREVTPVTELYGANGSYPLEILRAVGGWSPDFPALEDRDLSHRIREKFPDKQFYAMRDAHIIHDPGMPLSRYLLRQFRRGPFNLRFHRRYGILPPLFPFPIAIALAATYAGLLAPLRVVTVLLILPQLLYLRWLRSFLRTGRFDYLLFPYVQLAEETMVIAGLVRGL